jgi:hypothetical protein
MTTLREDATTDRGMELRWRQPAAAKRRYTLQREGSDTPLATLEWRSVWGTFATATVGDISWTFKRAGFLRPRVTVRIAGSDDDLATLEANWHGGGTLTIAGGATFGWKVANFWHSRWDWLDANGTELLHFANKQGFIRQEAVVAVSPRAVQLPELDLLAALGWYLLILAAQDSAATTAAVTT